MSSADFEKARKTFRGLGYSVVILGLLSLPLLSHASRELVAGTLVGIGLCTVTGIWLVAKPTVAIGVGAGICLVLLGILDLLLANEGGGFAFVAPLIDFGFAIRLFIGCASYARAAAAAAEEAASAGGG